MRERIWDEGYEVGYDDAIFDQRGLSTDSDADQYPHENPYRGLESADIDLAALRAAAEGATPGPWKCAEQTHGEWYGIQSESFALGNVFLAKDGAHVAAANPAVVLALLDRLAVAEEQVAVLEQVRADEWDADAPMPDSVTPEWGTEDYRRHAVLFNDITHCRIQRGLIFSDRLRLQRHLWALGWRRDVRDEDVTERTEEQP